MSTCIRTGTVGIHRIVKHGRIKLLRRPVTVDRATSRGYVSTHRNTHHSQSIRVSKFPQQSIGKSRKEKDGDAQVTGTRRFKCITPRVAQIAPVSHPSSNWIQDRMPVHQLLAGQTSEYLSSDIQLLVLPSASVRIRQGMYRYMHTQQFRWWEFFCCRSSCVKSRGVIYVTRHELQTFQEITERTYVHALDDHGTLWL